MGIRWDVADLEEPTLPEPARDPWRVALARLGRAVLLLALADSRDPRWSPASRAAAADWLRRPSPLLAFWCACAGVEPAKLARAVSGRALVELRGRWPGARGAHAEGLRLAMRHGGRAAVRVRTADALEDVGGPPRTFLSP